AQSPRLPETGENPWISTASHCGAVTYATAEVAQWQTHRQRRRRLEKLRLLNVDEVAEQLGISPKTFYNNKRLREELGAFKIGRQWRVPEEQLDAYVRKHQRSWRDAHARPRQDGAA